MRTYLQTELAKRSNARILALDTLTIPASGALSEKSRARIDTVFEERLSIIQAGSSNSQRLAYGVHRFATNFVVMGEFRIPESLVPPGLTPKALDDLETAIRQRIWKALPNCAFKRFQEIFCEPRKYIFPRAGLTFVGDRVFFDASARELLNDLSPCLVSPDRIGDELAESLGIVKFTAEERRSPLKRFLRKSREDVLEGIKARFESALPLSPRDKRFLIIDRRKQDEALSAKYPSCTPMPQGLHGTLLLISEECSLSRRLEISEGSGLLQPLNAVNRRAAHFCSAFEAARKTRHQAKAYDRERADISALTASLDQLKTRISYEWRRGAPEQVKQSLIGELRKAGNTALRLFEEAIDPNKLAAHGRLQTAKTARDSLGRLNPTVTAIQLGKAVEFLKARLLEITPKGGFNEHDRQLLEGTIAEHAAKIRDAAQALQGLPTSPRGGFRDHALLLPRLTALEHDLARVHARPLSSFAGIMRVIGRHCSKADTPPKRIQESIQDIQALAALLDGMLCIERIKSHLIDYEKLSPHYLHEQSNRLKQSGRTAGRFSATIEKAYELVQGLISSYDSVASSSHAQQEWTKGVREQIDTQDFEAVAMTLLRDYSEAS